MPPGIQATPPARPAKSGGHGGQRRPPVYSRGVLRGIFSKDITLDPVRHVNMTIRLEGIVTA
jgi:hypothetical protein